MWKLLIRYPPPPPPPKPAQTNDTEWSLSFSNGPWKRDMGSFQRATGRNTARLEATAEMKMTHFHIMEVGLQFLHMGSAGSATLQAGGWFLTNLSSEPCSLSFCGPGWPANRLAFRLLQRLP